MPDRFFLPWQPIRVSTMGLHFFSARGTETVASELLVIWLPALLIAAGAIRARRARRRRTR